MPRRDVHKELEYTVGYGSARAEAAEWSVERIRNLLGRYLDAQSSSDHRTAVRACGIVDGLTSVLMERGDQAGLYIPGVSS